MKAKISPKLQAFSKLKLVDKMTTRYTIILALVKAKLFMRSKNTQAKRDSLPLEGKNKKRALNLNKRLIHRYRGRMPWLSLKESDQSRLSRPIKQKRRTIAKMSSMIWFLEISIGI
jgi:hypothetical protein